MGTSLSPLRDLVPDAWRAPLRACVESPSFAALDAFVTAEAQQGAVFPPREQIFSALAATPPSGVKVVIIGQDPYPTAGNANGLAFSVSAGVKVPASLRNLFAGLTKDLGLAPPKSGDLTPWAQRGVLLLNTVLTVREGAANSHKGKGWEPFTEAVLRAVTDQPGPVVFLCLGVPARKMAERLVDVTRHHLVVAPHPSPLNGNAFVQAAQTERIFTRVNELLTRGGRGVVDWSLPT